MAVSKMEKVTILAFKENQNKLLETVQELQNIEIIDSQMDLSAQEKELIKGISPATKRQETMQEDIELQLAKIRSAISFLQNYSVVAPKAPVLTTQAFSEFENSVNEDKLSRLLIDVEEKEQKMSALLKEKEELLEAENNLEKWHYLTSNPNETEGSEFIESILGTISLSVKDPFLEALKEIQEVSFELVYESQSRLYLYLVYAKETESRVQDLLQRFSFDRETYSYKQSPAEAYKSVKEQLKGLLDTEKTLRNDLHELNIGLADLKQAEEVMLAKLEREKSKRKLTYFNRYILLRGWIEVDRKEQFNKIMEKLSTQEQPIVVTYEEPTEEAEVPTVLKNNRLVRPFEMVTEMYSLPKYGELDPTPFMVPFYLVFFGMMVADVGYGLLMLLITTLAKKFYPLRRSQRGFIDFFQILSVPVMLWGFIYGSIFGVDLPWHLLSTTEDMNTILLLSVLFGFIQILTGLLINGVQLIKNKKYLESVSDGFAWQGILVAAALLVLGKFVIKLPILVNVAIILFVASALLIIVIPAFTSESKGKGLGQGLYSFYGITNYIGDLVSYTRLMALGISGGSIAAAFNMLIGFMPPIARFSIGLVLLVLLHALNIFLSLLSAYVHGARLQYVEYFGKFFEGGGKKFEPLKPAEKYIDFEVDKEE